MATDSPQSIHLKDYRKPDYRISGICLRFQIFEEKTLVQAVLKIVRDNGSGGTHPPLVLNGEKLKLIEIKVNGNPLRSTQYLLSDRVLTLPNPMTEFELETVCEIEPHKNKELEGLYRSGKIFCTQNESEGFRKITYFLDRPDVMSKYKTRIEADRNLYPDLLSNGNEIASGELPDNRHYVEWEDPFPKPCYLFALVAGDLACVRDSFTTRSGKRVDLRIYVEKGHEGKTSHAMDCLKKAMKWDEDTFGLECDLNTYMIVAVHDFNFGAMENKGLNIFNAQYILADPKTATDQNFQGILGVIGHEYFHNWTGNRVTCRDWFQITLKEGLTIFRDQEFSADMNSRPVKRINDVRDLRDHQFIEDSGPNAHPIRPEAYIEINNFYTVTVYEKGAEVIRMIQTLIGRETFQKGIRKYFELFDGQAVTTEDFVHAMEKASGQDLTQFKRWYGQAGTPHCQVTLDYREKEKQAVLTVKQLKPKNFTSSGGWPYYFPLSLGLLGPDGRDLPLHLQGKSGPKGETTYVLPISKDEEKFVFENIPSRPVPSLLRGFSAPVYLDYPYTQRDLAFLFAHDSDEFNRYEAGQRLAYLAINRLMDDAYQRLHDIAVEKHILTAFGDLIRDPQMDSAFKAEALILPSLSRLTEQMEITDFEGTFAAREYLIKTIAAAYEDELTGIYEKLHQSREYRLDAGSVGKRSLKNTVLAYLLSLKTPDHIARATTQFELANNMTDQIAALAMLCHIKSSAKEKCLKEFYNQWGGDPLVINKWFAVQAASHLTDTVDQVPKLENDPKFDMTNPNKIRALYGVFSSNLLRFHEGSGKGYVLIADKILQIDEFNPSAAAHLASAFKKFAVLDVSRKILMEKQLRRILGKGNLSNHTYEIVSKTLAHSG